jgi:hypothetical protein
VPAGRISSGWFGRSSRRLDKPRRSQQSWSSPSATRQRLEHEHRGLISGAAAHRPGQLGQFTEGLVVQEHANGRGHLNLILHDQTMLF